MNPRIKLQLLGLPSYFADGELQALPSEHPLLLLTYLNAHEAWIDRKEILDLLFEGDDESVARNKLRQLLFRAKKQAWFDGFESRPQHLKHDAISDLRAFRTAVEQGIWQDAVTYYTGKLLKDTPVTNLASYEDWLEREREDIESSFEEAALWHAKELEEQQEHDDACTVILKLLSKDPLNEDAMQLLLSNAQHSTNPANAVTHYETFKTQLERDLSMEPLEETVALANAVIDALNKKNLDVLQEAPKVELPAKQELLNIPKGLPSFVGRDPELAHLLGLLEQEDSQLLTLIGLGGIGKTRLSLAVASEHAKTLKHGGVFVALASTTSADFIGNAILAALQLEPNAKQEPKAQVIDFLKDKNMLLVLDNFEHIMQANSFVQDLLNEAPELKILISSRERLNLRNEQIFELTGMALPETYSETTELEAYDATKLFLRSARRNNPNFTLNQNNRQTIFKLCQVLQGVPLALELAASWLRMMSVAEILEEATQSFDLLESDFSDLPERHQSLRAVFDSSWNLLSEEEQNTLTPLAIFTGGFTLDAAKTITNAKPRTLLRLVNKSLLRREQTGRFEFLEVIRQYSQEKLNHNTNLKQEVEQKHAKYFLELSKQAEPYLKGGKEQLEWLNTLEGEHSNLRKALEFYLAQKENAVTLDFANGLFDYWLIRGHWNEAQTYFDRILTLANPQEVNKQRLKTIVNTGYLATIQGHYLRATKLLEESVESMRALRDQEGLAYALLCTGLNANYQANYDQAQLHYAESLSIYKVLSDNHGTANTLHELGVVSIRKGEFEEAKEHLHEALELREALQDDRGASRTLANLGIVARRQGDYDLTEAMYAKSLDLSRTIKDSLSTANTLISYGVLVKLQGRYLEAKEAYEEALNIFQKANDKLGEAIILENLATLYRLQKNYPKAKSYAEASLQNHKSRNDNWGAAKVLIELGTISFGQDAIEESLSYFLEGQSIAQQLKDSQLQMQSFRALAISLSKTQHLDLSIMLLAKSQHLSESLQLTLAPTEQEQMDTTKARLLKELGEKSFKTYWQQGQEDEQDMLSKHIQELIKTLPTNTKLV